MPDTAEMTNEVSEFDTAFAEFESTPSHSDTVQVATTSEDEHSATLEQGSQQPTPAPDTVPTEKEAQHEETPNEANSQNDVNAENARKQAEIHKQNNLNAQRRIRQREATLKEKDNVIARLKERLAKYESKGQLNEIESMKVESLREQIEDTEHELSQEEYAYNQERLYAFNDQVAQEIGEEEARIAVPMIQRWADYVNTRERELANMAFRPYGKHLLYEWCTRVEKSPTALKAWESKTAYEKSRIITGLYEKIVSLHTTPQTAAPNPQSAQQHSQSAPQNVAVAQSGRGNTLAQPASSDDFGTALEQQMQKLGIRKF